MASIVSIFQLDPDFRRQPKTNHFCCVCQRDIRGEAAGWLHFTGGGFHLITDSKDFTTSDDMGLLPVGPECARKVKKTLGDSFLFREAP